MTELENLLATESRRLKIPVWWVGGPVRDHVMGRAWNDGDVTSPGALRLAQAVGRKLGLKVISLDEQFRIYRLVRKETGDMLDFAQLQGKTIEQDLARRDFTINAMARPVGGTTIVDPFGGRKDIERRRVRALSQKVLKDDLLRRLRAFRFSAQLDFTIDPQTLRWIQRLTFGKVAAERIREELLKLLATPRATDALIAMDKVTMLTDILPELEACRRTAKSFYGAGGVLKHSLASVRNLEWLLETAKGKVRTHVEESIGGHPRKAWLKLGALLHDIGKPATVQKIGGRLRFFNHEEVGADLIGPLARRLRFSRQETQLIRAMVKHHMRLGSLASAPAITPKAHMRYFRDLNQESISMILVSLADHYDYLAKPKWGKNTDPVEKMANRLLSAYLDQASVAHLPRLVDGHAVMKALRIKPSPVIGRLLQEIQDLQADGKVKTKADVLKQLPAIYRKVQRESTGTT